MYRYPYRGEEEEKKEQEHGSDVSVVSSSSVVSYQETEHARLRRKQRCIDKKDLKAAMKFGTRAPHFWGKSPRSKTPKGSATTTDCVRYTYNDIVYIVNEATQAEVTCYARPLTLDPIPIPAAVQKSLQESTRRVQTDLDCWTSNTVMVIDTSGSMRTSDMWGTRNRLKSVWFAVALDFLADRLETGNAKETDVLSIICMGDTPRVICQEMPTSWQLYNYIVALYATSPYNQYGGGVNPQGHGYFLPSLTKAEEFLKRNSNASCVAGLIFLSDGAPSDKGPMRKENIITKVEDLAKSFGRRLTFTAIGIGDLDDFSMLQKMVDAAKDYGAMAEFKLPSMTSSSLGITFTSVATSLTTTQTELTDLNTLTQRKVRDVQRESRSKASESLTQVNNDDFWLYKLENVTRKVYHEYLNADGMNQVYYASVALQHPDARFVAISKGPFGEGAERFAYRFFEVAADRKTIVGRPLVAKESRMVLETEKGMTETKARKEFVRKFIMTQQIARRLAAKFNDKLKAHPRIHADTPQISFLDCSIYELKDNEIGKSSVLVENKLDHNKWHKWNSNNGMVDGVKKNNEIGNPSLMRNNNLGMNEVARNIASLDLNTIDGIWKNNETGNPSLMRNSNLGMNEVARNVASLDLSIIEEGSEEGEEDEDEDEDGDDEYTNQNKAKILFTPTQVAQAFSHFSYLHSNRSRLVCDLQGVFDEGKNVLQFSDPVIHYYNPQRKDRRCVHGRTDRGQDGIKDFFATHSCKEQGNLCQLVTRGFRANRFHRRHANS